MNRPADINQLGWSRWNGSEYGFQGDDIGHPHWQFDALESLSAGFASQAESDRERLKVDIGQAGLREFGQEDGSARIADAVRTRKLSRIHFPSAAAWWMKEPDSRHVHSPASGSDVESWMSETLSYAVQELGRL